MTATATRPAAARPSVFRPLAALASAWRRLDRERRLRATIHALECLPDRSLRDIGLERGDIAAIVRGRGPTR